MDNQNTSFYYSPQKGMSMGDFNSNMPLQRIFPITNFKL